MATGTVQVWARGDDDDWNAGMKNPQLVVTGGVPKRPLPRGKSDCRQLSQILRKSHAQNFNDHLKPGVIFVARPLPWNGKTRTYFPNEKIALSLAALPQRLVRF
jgi:hypothetical protein